MFKLWYCKTRMTAYVNGELPLHARRRMARYIDECPQCYAEYIRQRHVQQELVNQIAAIGKPDAGQLDRIWSAIQLDMKPARPNRAYFQMRYGLVTLAVFFALALPLLLIDKQVASATVTQPTPKAIVVTTRAPEVRVAVATQVPVTEELATVSVLMPARTPEGE